MNVADWTREEPMMKLMQQGQFVS